METRLIFLLIGAALGYTVQKSTPRIPTLPLRQALFTAFGVLIAFVLFEATWSAYSPAFGLPSELFGVVPLHSLLLGSIAGYLLSDASATTDAAPPVSDKAGDGAENAEKFLRVTKPPGAQAASSPGGQRAAPLGLSLPMALLLAAGLAVSVVPPAAFGDLTKRMTGLKGPGFEFSLGTVAGETVAENIRTGAPPLAPLGSAELRDRYGFIAPRLERMEALAHPPKLKFSDEPGTTLATNPTAYLFSEICYEGEINCGISRTAREPPRSREIHRDRAMLLHLHSGPVAVDSRPRHSTPSLTHRAAVWKPPADVARELLHLGAEQERILTILAPHVSCVSEVIRSTQDRRLLEYQTARVVEALYRFARIWNALEYEKLAGRFDGARPSLDAEALRRAHQQLRLRSLDLAEKLDGFSHWALETLDVWRTGVPGPLPRPVPEEMSVPTRPARPEARAQNGRRPSTQRESKPDRQALSERPAAFVSIAGSVTDMAKAESGGAGHSNLGGADQNRCLSEPLPTRSDKQIPDYREHALVKYVEAAETAGEFSGRSGFTPYLALFVAQALSAMGDHTAALKLMVEWQKNFDTLVAAARKSSGTLVTRTAQAAHDAEVARFIRQAPWFRLATFVETVVLQELSENTDLPHPPTEAGLRYLIKDLYPTVLSTMSQKVELNEWRTTAQAEWDATGQPEWLDSAMLPCRAESHSWRQSLVLSYASWIKSYLDLRNKNFIKPDDAISDDHRLADLLIELDLQCFPDVIVRPHDQRIQRAYFVVTAAAVKMNLLVHDRLSVERRRELHGSLLRMTQRALRDLENSDSQAGRMSTLDQYIFGQDSQLINSMKSVKARLDQIRF